MEIRKISPDLQESLLAISRITSDSELTAAQKQEQLSALKTETLAKIDAGLNQAGFITKAFLENLRKSIEAESWRDIPTPEIMSGKIQVQLKLGEVLNSASSFLMPDLLELERLMKKIMLGRAEKSVDAKAESYSRSVDNALKEFAEKEKAIELQFVSSVVSASVGMALSAVQIGASMKMAKESTQNMEMAGKNLKSKNKDIEAKEIELKQQKLESEKLKREMDELKTQNPADKETTKKIETLEKDLKVTESQIKDIRKNIATKSTELQADAAEVTSRNQKLEAYQQLVKVACQTCQSTAAIVTAVFDKTAKLHELESDKMRFHREMEEKYYSMLSQEVDSLLRTGNDLKETMRAIEQSLAASISKSIA